MNLFGLTKEEFGVSARRIESTDQPFLLTQSQGTLCPVWLQWHDHTHGPYFLKSVAWGKPLHNQTIETWQLLERQPENPSVRRVMMVGVVGLLMANNFQGPFELGDKGEVFVFVGESGNGYLIGAWADSIGAVKRWGRYLILKDNLISLAKELGADSKIYDWFFSDYR